MRIPLKSTAAMYSASMGQGLEVYVLVHCLLLFLH